MLRFGPVKVSALLDHLSLPQSEFLVGQMSLSFLLSSDWALVLEETLHPLSSLCCSLSESKLHIQAWTKAQGFLGNVVSSYLSPSNVPLGRNMVQPPK